MRHSGETNGTIDAFGYAARLPGLAEIRQKEAAVNIVA